MNHDRQRSIQDAKSRVALSRLVGQYITLHKKGHEMVGLCPFHQDSEPSLSINDAKGIYKCFACGEAGDQVTFLEKYNRLSPADAIKQLKHMAGITDTPMTEKKTTAPRVLANLPNSSPTLGPVSATHLYRDAANQVIGAVLRFEATGGKKSFQQYTKTHDGWIAQAMSTPKPLYNLHQLAAYPNAKVLLVEGEKVANAYNGQKMGLMLAVTWPGGAANHENVDIGALANRNVTLWPDNDDPGRAAMLAIGTRLLAQGCTVSMLDPGEVPAKFDAADMDWQTIDDKAKWHEDHIKPWEPPVPETLTIISTPEVNSGPIPKPSPPPSTEATYVPLGYSYSNNAEYMWFYVTQTQQIIRLGAGFRQCDLVQLAPNDHWLANFTSDDGRKAKLDIESVRTALHKQCRSVGQFDVTKARGLGAWVDKGQLTYNAGSCLIRDGKRMALNQHGTKAVYIQDAALEYAESRTPATDAELAQLASLVQELPFAREMDAQLLLGWVLSAPLCGALPWRPHIWITGPAGSGKSWVLEHLVRPLLTDACLVVQSMTTEAGIRQTMGRNALPVVMDEAEGENPQAQQNIERILALARASSTANGGQVAKGSTGGQAQSFGTKSAFCFASINVSMSMRSDASRVTVIEMSEAKARANNENWTSFEASWRAFLTEDMVYRLQLRSLQSYGNHVANLSSIGHALRTVHHIDKRDSDQLAALLAGYWSCASDNAITNNQAFAIVSRLEISNDDASNAESDGTSALNNLLSKVVRVSQVGADATIYELHSVAQNKKEHSLISAAVADTKLRQLGISSKPDGLWVSISLPATRDLFATTPYAKGYARVIAPGQKAQTKHLEGTRKMRAVFIYVLPSDDRDPDERDMIEDRGSTELQF